MNVYIATSFNNKGGFHEMRQILEGAGHSVIHDWTVESVEEVAQENRKTYLRICAATAIMNLIQAEALVIIASPNMAGAFVEFGIALSCGIPIVVVDANTPGNQNCIFYHLTKVKHADKPEDVLRFLAPEPAAFDPSSN